MKLRKLHIVPALVLSALFTVPCSAATPPPKKPPAKVAKQAAKPQTKRPPTAPADEYFGRQKYSILGIRNTLHDINIRYDGSIARADAMFGSAKGLEDAMHDWDKKYHGDLWLAHYLFQLDQLYMRVPPERGAEHVEGLSKWIIAVYPNTFYGKYLVKIRKQREEARAKAKASAAPSPQSSASLAPSPTSAASPVASASPTATQAPSPAATSH